MDRIELFDKYISGEMSENEALEFNRQISEDKELASDFLVYKSIVRGVFKEEEQKGNDLDEAFKHLNKDDLRKIVGPRLVLRKPKAKIVYMASWVASVAAVLAIAFTMTFNIQRSARNSVDDVMFDCYYNPISRGGESIVDLSKSDEEKINSALPSLVEAYKEASDEQSITERGINLAMVYLKIHNRDKAKEIILDLKRKCPTNPNIQEQCDKLLEKIQ